MFPDFQCYEGNINSIPKTPLFYQPECKSQKRERGTCKVISFGQRSGVRIGNRGRLTFTLNVRAPKKGENKLPSLTDFPLNIWQQSIIPSVVFESSMKRIDSLTYTFKSQGVCEGVIPLFSKNLRKKGDIQFYFLILDNFSLTDRIQCLKEYPLFG